MDWFTISEAVADGMSWNDAKTASPEEVELFILLRNASTQRLIDAQK